MLRSLTGRQSGTLTVPLPAAYLEEPQMRESQVRTLPTANGYPERAAVPVEKQEWRTPHPEYSPVKYESASVVANNQRVNPSGWAEAPDISPAEFLAGYGRGERSSWLGAYEIDPMSARPLNPFGRTGIEGRGNLGKWGPNKAADPIVTRIGPESGHLEILLIERKSGHLALPGGFLDSGEGSQAAAQRELKEETSVELDFSKARKVFSGLVIDPRMTDNAWIESEAYHYHADSILQTPVAGSDARRADWFVVTEELLGSVYASHGEMIRSALRGMER